jgi:hypothetical protein
VTTRKQRLAQASAVLVDLGLPSATAGLIYVTAFPSRRALQKHFASIAWETEAWVADEPDHLIHFDGSRFLGPYGPT